MNNKKPVIAVIAFFILLLITFFPRQSNDKLAFYKNMINSDFGINLNEANSSIQFEYSLLSRDSVYSICYDLTPSYSQNLLNTTKWANDTESWNQKYLLPYVKVISGLDMMLTASQSNNSYSMLNIREDNSYSTSFSILLLDMDKSQLFYFYFSS